ncbi:Transcription factor COE2 [Ancistrocladus abbreviatus]
MPTLVKYNGEDELHRERTSYCNLLDPSSFYSINSYLDAYYPPHKRLRTSAPFVSWENGFLPEKKSSIEILPDECLYEIFVRLPGQERSACACVSKHWLFVLSTISKAEICQKASNGGNMASEETDLESDGCLTRCLEGKKATDIRLAAIAVGTATRGGLGKLSIRGSNSTRGVTNLGLSAIAHGCPSLKVLSIWNVSSVGNEGLFQIANGCRMLEKLDLCHCPLVTDRGLIAIAESCPNLTTLAIEACPYIGNGGLQAIARCCPKLESVAIKDCPLIGDQGVASLFLPSSSELAKVKLQGLNISDFSLAVIGHFGKSVGNLILSGLRNVSERGFWAMGNAGGLQALTSLTINSCRGMMDASLEAIGKGCPSLKQLLLRKCCLISDSGLMVFSKSTISLESLKLEECNQITQSGVLCMLSDCGSKLKSLSLIKCLGVKDITSQDLMFSLCRSLQSLSIRNCPGFGSVGLAILGKICPELRNVDLSGLYGITDDGLLSFLESCEAGLVKVNLSGCINLSDRVAMFVAMRHGETLKVLNFNGCMKVTDSTVEAIANSCQLLNDLDISKCAVTDSGIAALSCSEQLNLQILSLSGCSRISNKCIPFLAKLGKCLVGLNLKNCDSISSSKIDMLVQNFWRCEILY